MSSQYLRDRSGRTIGRIEDRGNEQVVFDASGRRVGRYDKRANKTYDLSGRMVGSGNLLTNLIPIAL
jgi:YD repeat-containing protein